jgi:hypothetical protein
MSFHRGVARDTLGNALNGASVSVFEPGTTTEASIYSEETLTTSLSNPFETGEDGVYEFYAEPSYYDIQVAKSGFTTVNLSDQVLGSIVGHIKIVTGDTDTVSTSPVIIDETYGTVCDWSLSYGGGFSIDANGHLEYDGNPNQRTLINCGVMFYDATGSNTMSIYLYKSGAPAGGGAQLTDFDAPSAGSWYLLTFSTVLELVTGDDLTLALQRGSGSATVGVQLGWITATGLG